MAWAEVNYWLQNPPDRTDLNWVPEGETVEIQGPVKVWLFDSDRWAFATASMRSDDPLCLTGPVYWKKAED